MRQFFDIIGSVFVICVVFYRSHYQSKLARKYQHHQAWQVVQAKASRAGYFYFLSLVTVISLFSLILLFKPQLNIAVSLNNTLSVALVIIALGQCVEIYSLKKYEKRKLAV